VLLVERRRQVGLPVQCAEYIPAMLVGRLELDKDFIIQSVCGMRTYRHSRPVKETATPGFTICRDLFDKSLAQAAVDAGADLMLATRAIRRIDNETVLLKPKDGQPFTVKARIIVGADGPRSEVGRWVGAVNNHLLPGVQVTLPLTRPLDQTEVYFDPEIYAGYGWLFPKKNLANVGLGLRKTPGAGKSIRCLLERFVTRLVAKDKVKAEPKGYTAGWIPAEPVRKAVYGNVLLAGDAAGQTHPITGAGIFAAVTCGQMAGKWAARAAAQADNDLLAQYDVQWQDLFAETQQRAYRRRVKMESEWENFGDIIESCWVAFRKYYEDSG